MLLKERVIPFLILKTELIPIAIDQERLTHQITYNDQDLLISLG